MSSIPNKIDVSPVIHTDHDLYHVSGGTVGSSYVAGDTLVYYYGTATSTQQNTIQYQDGVWSDLSSTENPTSVATNNNSQNIFIVLGDTHSTGFVNPFYSSGGTSTEGVPIANGSITIDSFGALYFTVDKSSPLTVGTHDYGFYLDGFLQGTINHSLSTLDAIGYQNNPADGLWQLSYQGGSSVQILASYTVGRKKVHSNFW